MNNQVMVAMLREALQEIVDCPQWVDQATVPRAGIEAAPHQVVMNMSVGLIRLRKARAALAASQDHADQPNAMVVPDGYKLVPAVPTPEMVAAGDKSYSFSVAKIFNAMLAAAPATGDSQ
jgi:hypothetical protein